MNLYSYVENNPITFGDPDGHAPPCSSSGNNCTELELSKIFVALQHIGSPGDLAAGIAGAETMEGVAVPASTSATASETLKDLGTMITDSASNLATRAAAGLDGLVDVAAPIAVPAVVVTGSVLLTPQTMGTGDVLSPAQTAAQAAPASNTNPFSGPVAGPVIVVDPKGNAIPVGRGQQLGGSKDGKWIQVKDENGRPTGAASTEGILQQHTQIQELSNLMLTFRA